MIKKSADPGKQHLNDSNAFIDFSNTVDEVFENVDNYNPCRKKKILVLLDEMIADIMTNKKRQAIIKEKFIRCRKFNTLLVFIMQSYFFVPKDVRQSWTLYLTTKSTKKLDENEQQKRIITYCN